MKLPFPTAARRRHAILVLADGALDLFVWEKRWSGWSPVGSASRAFASSDAWAEAVQTALQAALAECPAGAGCHVDLVLPAALGGLTRFTGGADADLAAAMPCAPNEASHVLLPVAASSIATGPRSLLWVQREWLDEVAALLARCRLRLNEIHARAQFMVSVLPQQGRPLGLLEADGALHLYFADGTPFRTATIDPAAPLATRLGRVRAELAAAAAQGTSIDTLLLPTGSEALADALRGDGILVSELASPAIGVLAQALWHSPGEGIWFAPPRQVLWRGFQRWAVAIAVVGLGLFLAMLWRSGQYEKEIGENSAAIRKLKPRHEKALAAEREALRVAGTLRGVGDIEKLPAVLDPLAILAEQLPAPVWLSEFSYRQGAVRLAGYGMNPDELKDALARLPGFSGMRAVAPPAPAEGRDKPFALEGRWEAAAPGAAAAPVKAAEKGAS